MRMYFPIGTLLNAPHWIVKPLANFTKPALASSLDATIAPCPNKLLSVLRLSTLLSISIVVVICNKINNFL